MSGGGTVNKHFGGGGEHEFPVFAYRFDHDDTQVWKRLWKCPYCDHSLTYVDEQMDVVEMAIVSHLTRRHGGQMRMLKGVTP